MKLRMLETRRVQKSPGAVAVYHGGQDSVHSVPGDLALEWIAAGAAEDVSGEIRRVDLLTFDEAIAARLVPAPAEEKYSAALAAHEAQRRPVVIALPTPEAPPVPTLGSVWTAISPPPLASFARVTVAAFTDATVTVTNSAGEEYTDEREHFTTTYRKET